MELNQEQLEELMEMYNEFSKANDIAVAAYAEAESTDIRDNNFYDKQIEVVTCFTNLKEKVIELGLDLDLDDVDDYHEFLELIKK